MKGRLSFGAEYPKIMKKSALVVSFLLGAIFSVHAQNIVVIGRVENMKEGTVFGLEETTGTGATRFFSKDSDEDNGKVINGKFVLNYQCSLKESRHFALYSNSPGLSNWVKLEFWADQGDTVYVEGKGNLLGTWKVRTDAPEQKEFDVIRKGSMKELEAYQQSWLDYEAYKQYRRETDMTEAEWDKSKVILAKKDTLKFVTRAALYKKQLEVMKHLPVTDFWMDYLGTIIYFVSRDHDRRAEYASIIKEIYMQNADKIDRKPDGKAVRDWVYPYPKAELGKLCTDGEMFDKNGKKYRFADFRGKYVLLDFWANYCGACIRAFPQIKKIQEKYADRLTVISLSVDKVSVWKTSPYEKEISWYSMNDGGGFNGGLAGSYELESMPTYILISPDGTYKARLNSNDIYNGTLEKYISENQ